MYILFTALFLDLWNLLKNGHADGFTRAIYEKYPYIQEQTIIISVLFIPFSAYLNFYPIEVVSHERDV